MRLSSGLSAFRDKTVEHWDLTSALIRQFHTSELVGLGLLNALLPGLVHVAHTLSWGRDGPWQDPEAFAADLLTTAWTVLETMGGSSVAYPERRVLDRVRRQLGHQREAAHRHAQRAWPISSQPSVRLARPGLARYPIRDQVLDCEEVHPISVLESLAIALERVGGVEIPREDAKLLFAHRVLGYSLAELAAQSGEKIAALKYRRRRAEAILCMP